MVVVLSRRTPGGAWPAYYMENKSPEQAAFRRKIEPTIRGCQS
jgi:hypothetical protein